MLLYVNMPPHKDPAKLPTNDQLKLLRDGVDRMEWDFSVIKSKQRSHDDQFKLIKVEFKTLNKRFDRQDKKFDKLYKLISGFVGRIKSQDEEIGTLNVRVTRLEKPIRAVIS